MDIKTIVVPVDGSDHSSKAVSLAAEIANKYGAKLSLLHVLLTGPVPDNIRKLSDKEGPELPGMAVGASYVEPSLPREVLEDIAEKLLAQARGLAEKAGVKDVETTTASGPAAKEILEHADKVKADMIVMGSRGLGDLKGLLVGSTSHKVQNLAKCTVATVK